MLAHQGPIVLVWFMWTIVLNHSHNDLWRREEELVCVHDNMKNRPFSLLLFIFLLNHKLFERHPVMIPFSQGVQSHILNYSWFPPHPPLHYLLIHSHSFFPSVILLLSKTHQSLVQSFFQLSFQMKTRLTLVLTMTHSSRLPPYPIYSAQCPRRFAPCVSSITPLFPSIHPSSPHFQEMTTSLSSLPLLVFLSLGS